MKIAIAQINTTIGAFKKNCEKICAFVDRAAKKEIDLIVFPEMTITGYPPKDLLDRPGFVSDNIEALENIKKHSSDIAIIVGYVDLNSDKKGKYLFNAAAFIHNGAIISKHYKSLLPSYDVFDEHRYFKPASLISTTEYNGTKFGITICEDIWTSDNYLNYPIYHIDPVKELVEQKAEFIVNISASPFNRGKIKDRNKLISNLTTKHRTPLIYVNQVGGNDDLIFDGNSIVYNAEGTIVSQCASFEEDLMFVEIKDRKCYAIDDKSKPLDDPPCNTANIYNALILGLKDYVTKCGFKKVVLGLSGGIDSAVVAVIAAKAVGKENVIGVAMPSKYSTKESVNDAEELAKNLGIEFKIIPIVDIHNIYTETFAPLFKGLPEDATEENLQARMRGNIIMALSNKFGYLVLTTGNKSELAVGYCTLYGDMCGGLAVISDVPKMMVYDIARFINSEIVIIPLNTIEKAPSAELRPNQSDQDSLPPYPILDAILKAYIEDAMTVDQIAKLGYDKDQVHEIIKKVNRNEYKRKQAAPGLRVTSKAFGSGRRIPIAQQHDEY